jgi:hypothetical protein
MEYLPAMGARLGAVLAIAVAMLGVDRRLVRAEGA